MKKTDLIHKLKQLQGISDDERAYLINLVNTKKKYGLVWEDKPEDVEEQLRENLPVLKEVKERAIINGEEYPNHILIEGDNLHALTALTFTHEGKIDVVYADPPYNTGNKTWKYNNNYIDDEDPFRHSKWIAFMERRLKILKRLLSPTGIVCITIDNYEVHNLRHLMEEIFTGREIIITVIEHNFRGRAKNNFALTHEYALWAVPKDIESITRLKEKSADISRNLRRTGQGSRRHESPTLFYGIEVDINTLKIVGLTEMIPQGQALPVTNNPNTEYVWPIDNEGLERRWYYGIDTAKNEIKSGNIWAKRLKGRIEVHYWKPGNDKRRKSVWTGPQYDGSTYGSELLTEVIGPNDFPFPKSIYAVIECLEAMSDKKDITALDFFAGSGTTGHAIMKMNEKDNGNRKFILCTANENNICEEITYPRNRNVITGYNYRGKSKKELFRKSITITDLKKPTDILDDIESIKSENSQEFDSFEIGINSGELILTGIKEIDGIMPGLNQNNLRYFKCEFVSREPSIKNKKEITRLATELLCIKEDIYNEQKQIGGYQLNATYVRCFQQGHLYLLVIYDEDVIEQMVEVIQSVVTADTDRNTHFKVYVFSNGQYPYTEEFEEVLPYITLCALPDAIYKAYQNVLPKRQRQQVPELEEPTAEDVETSLQDEANPNLFNQAQ